MGWGSEPGGAGLVEVCQLHNEAPPCRGGGREWAGWMDGWLEGKCNIFHCTPVTALASGYTRARTQTR